MTRRIDRAVIMSLVLANIVLIGLVAAQGQRIDEALERVEALAAREEQAAERESTLGAAALAPGAGTEDAGEKGQAPQEPEKAASPAESILSETSAPKAQAAAVRRSDLPVSGAPGKTQRSGLSGAAHVPDKSIQSQGAPAESIFSGEQAFTAYAYCACEICCGEWAKYGKTASGTTPEQGRTVAVDPSVIPLGAEIWIDGAGPYTAEDTGSGIDGRTIDVFFDSHEDALAWGKRTVEVTWEK